MRVLVVASDIRLPDVHGGSTHVGELIRHLRHHGPVLPLLRRNSTLSGALAMGWSFGTRPVVRHLAPGWYALAALAPTSAFGPDVIYERASSYGTGALLSYLTGAPLLVMLLDQRYSPLSLHRAHTIVTTNPDLVPVPYRARAVRVSWGANSERFRPGLDGEAVRRRLRVQPDEVLVGYCGSFREWHGLQGLVEAATRLRQRKLRFLLIGDGPRRDEIDRQIGEAGLRERFILAGAVPYEEVPALLSAADLCVAPFVPSQHPGSRAGGFALDPLKVFEYLALGKPTITIRAPNIEALFEDGVHLWLHAAGDAEGLAHRIAFLCDNPALATRSAAVGRARVLERHTWRHHADHLVRLFSAMVAKRTDAAAHSRAGGR